MTKEYEKLLDEVNDLPLSTSLGRVLRLAQSSGETELAAWARLELLGYLASNPAMTERTIVPEYRTVGGQWFDEYGRPLVIADPKLAFINETRLRSGVAELESFIGANGTIAIRLPEFSEIIRKNLGVEVTIFRFSPRAVPIVLANVKAQLLDRLSARPINVQGASEVVRPHPQEQEEDILELRPNVSGIGINLKALWRRWRSQSGEE